MLATPSDLLDQMLKNALERSMKLHELCSKLCSRLRNGYNLIVLTLVNLRVELGDDTLICLIGLHNECVVLQSSRVFDHISDRHTEVVIPLVVESDP